MVTAMKTHQMREPPTPEQIHKDRITMMVIFGAMVAGIVVLAVLSAMGVLPEPASNIYEPWMMP